MHTVNAATIRSLDLSMVEQWRPQVSGANLMFDGETTENHCFWGKQNLRNRSCRLSAYEDIIGSPFCLLRFVESSKALPVENLKE